jgi:hypothetical protein
VECNNDPPQGLDDSRPTNTIGAFNSCRLIMRRLKRCCPSNASQAVHDVGSSDVTVGSISELNWAAATRMKGTRFEAVTTTGRALITRVQSLIRIATETLFAFSPSLPRGSGLRIMVCWPLLFISLLNIALVSAFLNCGRRGLPVLQTLRAFPRGYRRSRGMSGASSIYRAGDTVR